MLRVRLQLRNKWHIEDIHQVLWKIVYFPEPWRCEVIWGILVLITFIDDQLISVLFLNEVVMSVLIQVSIWSGSTTVARRVFVNEMLSYKHSLCF